MKFNRKQYLNQLISAEGNGMIKIITGIRRCGKSFLLFNIFHKYLQEKGVLENHIIQVNLEDRRNKQLRNADNLLNYIDSLILDTDKYYILLDEIQMVPEFEDVLNSYLSIANVEVYVTGSNAKFLSKDVITEFRGRGWEIRIHPLSFSEYYETVGGEKAEALETYYLYGGLPAVYQFETAEEKQNYLREIYETVYLRDVQDRNRLKNPEGMRELVRILASIMGSSINVRRIVNTFRSENGVDIAATTINRYLEFLQDAFFINEALRFDVKGRKYIGTETKYYFEDIGIRNAIVGFRQLEFTHTMENVIYNELRRLGFSVDVGLVECFKRNTVGKLQRNNLEIDFVVNRHDERLYIQSAYAMPDNNKMEQEQASLLQVADGFRKIIITGDRFSSKYNDNGILIMGLYDFLLGKEHFSGI
ncbi:MAG: ATP-binding protein [Bacteroidaceae bacterium]|nr:ATP-binding protein [Bacteroidaceae bacterium]